MATPLTNSTPTTPVGSSNQNYIDSLLAGRKWGNGPAGTAVQNLEYSFIESTQLITYTPDPVVVNGVTILTGQQVLQNFSDLTQDQRTAADAAINTWAEIANIGLTPRGVEPNRLVGDINNQVVGDIRFARSNQVNDISTAYAIPLSDSPNSGDLWFSSTPTPGNGNAYTITFDTAANSLHTAANLLRNTYAYETFLHEIGHALGLKHPGNYNGGNTSGGTAGPFLPAAEDNYQYSLMSYNLSGTRPDGTWQPYTGTDNIIYPSTPLIYDIAAIQYLYGPNNNTRSGNDTYSWDPNRAFIESIWDAGGSGDTISAANQSLNAVIDLTVNVVGQTVHFSSIGPRNDFGFSGARNNLTIAFGVIIENATGGSGDDVLIGNAVANVLNGGLGRDTMRGGQGDDTYYVDNVGDSVIEVANEGTADLVYSSLLSYTLTDNVENLTLLDSASKGTGNGLGNIITGNDQSNVLDGKEGDDFLYGRGGDDRLIGGIGADLLDGGTGSDTASYATSSSGVTVNLATGQGSGGDAQGDRLISIENLEGSDHPDSLTGNNQANYLWGLGGDDTLNGLDGDDTLIGGDGNDFIDGGNGSDTVSYQDTPIGFSSPVGVIVNIDVTAYQTPGRYLYSGLFSSTINGFDPTLGVPIAAESAIDRNYRDTLRNLENIIGSSLDDVLIGNSSENKIYGLAGNDILVGNAGNDTLDGGDGIDTVSYQFDLNAVSVNLETGTATDGSGKKDLLANIENIVGSSKDDRLIGNNLINWIYGGSGKDIIEARGGNDILYGEAGDDQLFGESGDDKLVGGSGADLLNGGADSDTASYITALTGIVANLTNPQTNTGDAQGDIYISIENLEGSRYDDTLVGDSQSNHLWGLEGNDYLDGFGGTDILEGGLGNDTYRIDTPASTIIEYVNQGIDTVNASINYTLGDNLENLNLLEGTAAYNGIGNELQNTIIGNSYNNYIDGGNGDDILYGNGGGDTILGGNGNDTLFGGQGADILTGGSGNDRFVYNSITDAGDRITDFTIGSDKIVLNDIDKILLPQVVNSSGWRSSNLFVDGFLTARQASNGTAALLIDPDGRAGRTYFPAPFILFDKVSAAALGNMSNFMV